MKRYFYASLLLSVATSLSAVASVTSTDVGDSKPPLATVQIPGITDEAGKKLFLPHQVALTAVAEVVDPQGQAWSGGRIATGGTSITVANRLPVGHYDAEAIKKWHDFVRLIEVYSGADDAPETRNYHEFMAEQHFLEAYVHYRDLLQGVRDFTSGETTQRLIRLGRYLGNLELDSTNPAAALLEKLPALIAKVREKGNIVKKQLAHDLLHVQQVLNDLVTDLESYLQHRSPLVTEASIRVFKQKRPDQTYKWPVPLYLRDLLPPADETGSMAIKLPTTKVAVGTENITDVNRMFADVERSLTAIIGNGMSTRIEKLRGFLNQVDQNIAKPESYASRDDGTHRREIIASSAPLKKYLHVFPAIDRFWQLPQSSEATDFVEGVKFINMALEELAAYAKNAFDRANGVYSHRLLEADDKAKQQASSAPAAVADPHAVLAPGTVSEPSGLTINERELLRERMQKGEEAAKKISQPLEDINVRIKKITVYLSQP